MKKTPVRKSTRRVALFLAAGFVAASLGAAPVLADPWHDDRHYDDHHFHEYDHWRGGNWFHGPHGGRDGWWWIVDGSWYFYPAPVYPYPEPYAPPVVVTQPGTVEMPPQQAEASGPSAFYYCDNPRGYYPTVPQCYAPWQRVEGGAPEGGPPPDGAPGATPPGGPPPMEPMPQPQSQQAADAQQLSRYTAAFGAITSATPDARSKLYRLGKKVEAFHHALYDRDYNAMAMLRDSEDLEHRIAAERARLAAESR